MEKPNRGNVRFIRVHGRVVPVGQSSGVKRPPGKKPAASLTPRKQLGLTGTQKFGIALGVGAVAGAAVYVSMRRFKASPNVALAALQKDVQASGGLTVATNAGYAEKRSGVRQYLFGNRIKAASQLHGEGVAFNYHYNDAIGTKHTINPIGMQRDFGLKRNFGKMFGETEYAPRTAMFEDVFAKAKGVKKNIGKAFGESGYIIKPDAVAKSKFSDFLDEASVLERANKSPRVAKLLEHPTDNVVQAKLALTGEYRAHFLNGEVFGISHRYMPNETLRNAWNKFVPGGAGGAFVPVMNRAKRREIESFVKEAMGKHGPQDLGVSGKSLFTAFDIGDTKTGLKLIEAQPSMGTFTNPLVNRQFLRHASGKWGHDVAAGAATVSGATAAGVTYTLTPDGKIRKKKRA